MQTHKRKPKRQRLLPAAPLLGKCFKYPSQWFINAVAFREAFHRAIRLVYPCLPMRMFRMTVLKDGSVWTIDDIGQLCINRMPPLDVLREHGCKVFLARLWLPIHLWAETARCTIIMYHRVKDNSTSELASESSLEFMGAHLPNDQAQAQPRSTPAAPVQTKKE